MISDSVLDVKLKSYDKQELTALIAAIDEALLWIGGVGIADSVEDVIAVKLGVPVTKPTDPIPATSLYAIIGDKAVLDISVDMIKVSVRTDASRVYSQSYVYKSPYEHKPLDPYFVTGVENRTPLVSLNTYTVSPSALAHMPVEYSVNYLSVLPLPSSIHDCLLFLAQNPSLLSISTDGTGQLTYGDTMYFTPATVHAKLEAIRAQAVVQIDALDYELTVPASLFADIKQLLIETGYDKSFTDTQYGGLIQDLRLVLRVPASRFTQRMLESCMNEGDVFDDLFKTEWLTLNDKPVNMSPKKDDYLDPYSTDKLDSSYIISDSPDGFYGCRDGTTRSYRHWKLKKGWIQTLTTQQQAMIFWTALELDSNYNGDPCPLDEGLSILIVVIGAIVSILFPPASGGMQALVTALTVAAAVVTIAGIKGWIHPGTAQRVAIVLSIVTLGITAYSTATQKTAAEIALNNAQSNSSTALPSTVEALQDKVADLTSKLIGNITEVVLSISKQVLEILNEEQAKEHSDRILEKETLLADLTEEAEEWEKRQKFEYSSLYSDHVTSGPEADPYLFIKDRYEEFSIYSKHGGFMS